MALNPNPSQLDQQQILKREFESSDDRLRVDAQITATLVDTKITDGVIDATITTVAAKNGLDVNIVNNSIAIGIDGVYNATTNPVPDNVGLVARQRNASPADSQQTQRLTSVTNSTIQALDVALLDESGLAFSSTNPLDIVIRDITGSEIGSTILNRLDLSGPADEITETISASLIYKGRSYVFDSATSDPVWQISRTRLIGNTSYTDWALDATHTAQWTDRASYFGAAGLLNTTSLLFDGVNDSVSFGNVFNYDSSNAWSFSTWLKLDNYAAQRTIYSKSTNDANVYGWTFSVTTGGVINVLARAPGTLTSTNFNIIVPVGTWFHFAFTYAGGSNINGARIYINGVVDTVPGSTGLNSLLASQTAYIGMRNTAIPFSGKMDEVSIWNKELSQAEVTSIYNSGAPNFISQLSFAGNLVNWYRFDNDTPGPTITDEIGGVNGTMINMSGASNFTSDVP